MDRSTYAAHEGLKAGRLSPEYIAAKQRLALERARAALRARMRVRVLRVLLVANAVVWTVQYLRGAL